MQDVSSPPPSWFARWTRLVLRLGMRRTVALMTAVVALLSVTITLAILGLTGRGDALLGAGVAAACALLLTPLIGSAMLRLVFELEEARRQLSVLATQDDLTGAHNRRHFMALAEREWSRCRRYETAAAVLLVDADRFKSINDSHGHLCGDAMLREITRLTGESLRSADVLARFGGEELIVFLPHTDPLGALDVAERIRERVSELRMPWRGSTVVTTVSIGVASLDAEHHSLDALIHDADTALYAAKEAGRNCVRAAPIRPRRSGENRTVTSR